MNKYLILIIVGLLSLTNNLFSSDKYTNNEINDKLKVINKNYECNFRIYFFISLDECKICLPNIQELINFTKNQKQNIEFAGFISGVSNPQVIEKIKKDNNWDFDIFADVIGAYSNEYKTKKTNFLILMNGSGSYLGAFSASELDSLQNIINHYQVKEEINSKDTSKSLKQIRNLTLKFENQDGYACYNPIVSIISIKKEEIYILDLSNNKIIIADFNAKIKEVINANQIENYKIISISSMQWKVIDESIIIQTYATDLNNSTSIQVFEYNLTTKLFHNANTLLTYYSKSSRFFEMYWNTATNQWLGIYKIFNTQSNNLDSISNPISIICNDGKNIVKDFGEISDIYKLYNLNSVYREFLAFSKNYIYSMQNSANEIFVYDNMSYSFIKSIKLKFSDKKRNVNSSAPIIASKDNMSEFLNNFSMCYGFANDPLNNQFAIYFRNTTYPKGATDFFSDKREIEDYIDVFDSQGNLLTLSDNLIKHKNVSLAGISNNKLYVIHNDKDLLHLSVYKY